MNGINNVTVVEPHADDAFLSMGGLIEALIRDYHEVTIMTVYSGTRKRAADAKAYADAVGAKWIGLGFEESGSPKETPGAIPLAQLEPLIWTLPVNTVVLPLGIGGHLEHLHVKEVFEGVYNPAHLLYYVDQPYASKLKNQDELQQILEGRAVRMVLRPGARKYRHTALFKDQSKFFHFNPPTELEMKGFELVVK